MTDQSSQYPSNSNNRDSASCLLQYRPGEVIENWDRVPIGSIVSCPDLDSEDSYEWLTEDQRYIERVTLHWLGKGAFPGLPWWYHFRYEDEVLAISPGLIEQCPFTYDQHREETLYRLRSFDVATNRLADHVEDAIFLGSEIRVVTADQDYMANDVVKTGPSEYFLDPKTGELWAYVKGAYAACFEEVP